MSIVVRETRKLKDTKYIPDTILLGEESSGAGMYSGMAAYGENGRYTINELFASGGEADIYSCQDEYFNDLVIKIYKTKRIDANKRQKVVDLLKRRGSEYIIPLVDMGNINGYCFDVYPWYEKRDLGGYRNFDTDSLIRTIIPNVNKGLKHIHDNGIIHRDIKPGNLLLDSVNKRIVIGDFGIVSLVRGGAKNIVTSTSHRTNGFAAPELYGNVVSTASDYYSFGITLLCLLRGKDIYEGYTEKQILLFTTTGQIPSLDKGKYRSAGFVPSDDVERIEALVCGLTLIDQNDRWGYDEVNSWLSRKQTVPVMPPDTSAAGDFASPYKIFSKDVTTYEGLCDTLLSNWDKARENYVYTEIIRNFLTQYDADKASAIFRLTDKEYTRPKTHNVGMMRCLYAIDENLKDFVWLGIRYKDLTEFAEKGMPTKYDDSTAQLLITGTLSWYADMSGKYENKYVRLIQDIEARAAADPQQAYQDFLIAFLPRNDSFDFNGNTCRSVDDLLNLLEKDRHFIRNCMDLAGSSKFYVWLRSLGFMDAAIKLRNNVLRNDNLTVVRMMLEAFGAFAKNNEPARKLAVRHGGYYKEYEFFKDLDHATCGIKEARELKENFERLNIKNAKSVTETYNHLHIIKDWYDSHADMLGKLGKSYRDIISASNDHLRNANIESGSASRCSLAAGFFGILTGVVLLAGLVLLAMGFIEGLFAFGVALFFLVSTINSFGRANEIGTILRSHSVISSLKNDVNFIENSINTGSKRGRQWTGRIVSIKETSDLLRAHSGNIENLCQALRDKQENVPSTTKAAYIASSLCFALMTAMLAMPFVMDLVVGADTGWGWLYDAAPIATVVVSVVSVIVCIVAYGRHRGYSFKSFLLALASPFIGAAVLGVAAIVAIIVFWIVVVILVIAGLIIAIFSR